MYVLIGSWFGFRSYGLVCSYCTLLVYQFSWFSCDYANWLVRTTQVRVRKKPKGNKHKVESIHTKVVHIENYRKYQHLRNPYKEFMKNEPFTTGCYSGCFTKPEQHGGWLARCQSHHWEILVKEHPKVAKRVSEVGFLCVYLGLNRATNHTHRAK